MQIFFALSCLLAILALSSGASIQTRAEDEAQAAAAPTLEIHQTAESAIQSGAAEIQIKEEAIGGRSTTQELTTAAIESTNASQATDEAARDKRHLHNALRRKKACKRSGCVIPGCASSCGQIVSPCLQAGGCGQIISPCLQAGGCGQIASPCLQPGGCGSNTIVVHKDVPVPHPVPIHVPIVKVLHQNVPVPQPIPVPIVKVVRVPVPVISQPVQPCCGGQIALPCSSPCSG